MPPSVVHLGHVDPGLPLGRVLHRLWVSRLVQHSRHLPASRLLLLLEPGSLAPGLTSNSFLLP